MINNHLVVNTTKWRPDQKNCIFNKVSIEVLNKKCKLTIPHKIKICFLHETKF